MALVQSRVLPLPFKLNQAGRHHIPQQRRKVGCVVRIGWLVGAERLGGVGERPPFRHWTPTVPFKLNQAGRPHIPRQKHKVTNWPAYDASLRQRGSLTAPST